MFKWIILDVLFWRFVNTYSILTCVTSFLQNQSASVSSRMRQRPVSGSLASREKRRETPLQRCQLLTTILPVPNTVTSVLVAPVIMYLVWNVRVVLFGVVWRSARSLNHDIDECFVSKLREGSAPCVDSPCLPSAFYGNFLAAPNPGWFISTECLGGKFIYQKSENFVWNFTKLICDAILLEFLFRTVNSQKM